MKEILINVVKSFFGVICTCITLLQFFMGTDTYEKLKSRFNIPDEIPREHKIFAFVLAFFILLAYNIWIYLSRNKKAELAASKIHLFHHEVRNEIFDMRKLNKEKPTMNHITYYNYVKGICYKLCEHIHEYLKNNYGKEFSVCIKMIDSNSLKTSGNIDDAKVYTLCRAGKEYEKREEYEKKNYLPDNSLASDHIYVNVKGNTDFYTILSNDKKNIATTAFACSNLRMLYILSKILKNVNYENTTPKFWKYYKSTIVVPIRIEKKHLSKSFEVSISGDGYQTIAFLCIDHKKPISKALKEEIAGYMKGFGDAFYGLLHEVAIMDRSISAEEAEMVKSI